jgi:hypothetical protein
MVGLGVLFILLSAAPILDWARFDRTSAIGPADYTLEADFDPVGFDYKLDARSSGSGGIGSGLSLNITKNPGWRTYPQISGEFMDNIGLIYNSYREKTFVYEIIMKNPPSDADVDWDPQRNPSAYLNVSLHSDMIPWWREGSKQELTVTVTYVGNDLLGLVSDDLAERFVITLSRVQIRAAIFDDEADEYLGRDDDRILYESEQSFEFREIGDSRDFKAKAEFPEGTSRTGLYADISASLIDYWGRRELSTLSGNANPINIYPVENSYFMRGLGIPLALPLMMISVLAGLVHSGLSVLRKGTYLYIIIPAAALAVIAPLWFITGMNAAVGLLGQRLSGAQEGLAWGAGLYLSITGALLMLGAMVVSIVNSLLSKRRPEVEPDTDLNTIPGSEPADDVGSVGSERAADEKSPKFRRI